MLESVIRRQRFIRRGIALMVMLLVGLLVALTAFLNAEVALALGIYALAGAGGLAYGFVTS